MIEEKVMRIAVVANCQGEGIASALQALNPGFEAKFVITTDIHNGSVSLDDLLSSNDAVIAQRNSIDHYDNHHSTPIYTFPNIGFDGYHPDITFLRGIKRGESAIQAVTSDMVIYHSAIAFFCYQYDISVDQTLNHYNHYVMSRLGYADRWNQARDALLAEGEAAGMPLSAELHRWAAQGSFMFSNNHPHIRVLVDIARRIMERMNVPVINQNVTDYLPDALKAMPVWPIYPPVATRLGLKGDYVFKRHEPHGLISLRSFVESSFRIYDQYEKNSLESLMLTPTEIAARLYPDPPVKVPTGNPYKDIDSRQFWKNAVTSVEVDALDPVFETKFYINKTDKVATAGSCFAQHIARTLEKSGFNYFVPESAPDGLGEQAAHQQNYGVFSARYGNIYTVRQLVQLLDRVSGQFVPDENYWLRKDGALVDPFRPQIEPAGFVDVQALQASRETHFAAVRAMFEQMDVFVFTLGLTEGWRSKVDGAVFPLAPGVAGGAPDLDRYEFVNFTAEEVTSDLFRAIDLIRTINPACRIILTVSPVPLIATYEPRHALVSTTYSKSVLRVAAQQVADTLRDVDYFGSFEIITGAYNRGTYFEDDLRSVREEGVSHVMKIFMQNYTNGSVRGPGQTIDAMPVITVKPNALFDVVCDEESIANF